MLTSLAHRFTRSPLQRQILFLAATAVVIVFAGYYFGTFDQVFHIPFLRKDVDPALYPGDPFFTLQAQHYTYFWFFFRPFYQWGVLEIAMFGVHVVATYLTFWALWSLSDTLFQNPLTNLLTVIVFAAPHLGFAGFPVFEFSLLNRTFVLPFLLWAITLYLRRRYLWAYFLLGVMYNLHLVSVNFVLALFLFDSLWRLRVVGWRNALGGLLAFVVGALPVLLWKLHGSPLDFSLRPDWLDVVRRTVFLNQYELFSLYPPVLLATLGGVTMVFVFFAARRRAASPQHDEVLLHFMYAILLILAVQVVTTHGLPITFINQLQIIRVGVFAVILGYLYLANYLAVLHEARSEEPGRFEVFLAAALASAFPLLLGVIWVLWRALRSVRWRTGAVVSALITMYLLTVGLALSYHLWRPGLHIFPEQTAWHTAQFWARDHTPVNAVFITPPYLWWFYASDWRVLSERSTVATFSETTELAFVPDYLDVWRPRFESIAPGVLARFRGDVFENLALTEQAYYDLSDAAVLAAARQWGVSYFVVEKQKSPERPWPVAYENDQYRIYELAGDK